MIKKRNKNAQLVQNVRTGERAMFIPEPTQPNIPKGWVPVNSSRNRLNSDTSRFDYDKLHRVVRSQVEKTLTALEDSCSAQIIAGKVPGYNPDWCADDFTKESEFKRKEAASKMTQYIMEELLAHQGSTSASRRSTSASRHKLNSAFDDMPQDIDDLCDAVEDELYNLVTKDTAQFGALRDAEVQVISKQLGDKTELIITVEGVPSDPSYKKALELFKSEARNRQVAAQTLMLTEISKWAREAGYIVKDSAGVRFKETSSAGKTKVYLQGKVTLVVDDDRYEDPVAAAERERENWEEFQFESKTGR